MNDVDDVIAKLAAVYEKANAAEKVSIEYFLNMAELLKKQFSEQIKTLNNSSNELIERING